MRKLVSLTMAAAISSLALTAIAAPVAAAGSGRVAFVNGVPGTKIDICVNGREIKSALPYGKKKAAKLGTGAKTFKFFKKNVRRCGGVKLGSKTVPFPKGSDLTIVVTKKAPKVLVFDNSGLGVIKPSVSMALVEANASDIANVTLQTSGLWDPSPIEPDIDPVWDKGDQWVGCCTFSDPWVNVLVATIIDTEEIIAGPVTLNYAEGRRYEVYLVGTNVHNARFVVLKRPVSFG